jgi:hypothetical protein
VAKLPVCRDKLTGKLRVPKMECTGVPPVCKFVDDPSCELIDDPIAAVALAIGKLALIAGGAYLVWDGRGWRRPLGLLAIAYSLRLD